jgi:diguanylate cyclase (GGDEF)-like protein
MSALRQVAKAAASRAMRVTDLAARYDGEEFVLLFPKTPLEPANNLAEQVRQQVEALAIAHPRSPTAPFLTKEAGRDRVRAVTPAQVLSAVD